MRIRAAKPETEVRLDMTAMIDVVFQLLTFFVFVSNFSKSEYDERIRLPIADLATAEKGLPESSLVLNVTEGGLILWRSQELGIDAVRPDLAHEAALIRERMEDAGQDPRAGLWTRVIVRADGRANCSAVQRIIRSCQEEGFVNFQFKALKEE